MGLLGLLATMVLMALGAGYYFFAMPRTSMTISNTASVPVVEGVSLYNNLKDQANTIKTTAEEQARETMIEGGALEEAVSVPAPVAKTETTLPITDRLMATGFSVPTKARTIDTIVLHSSYNPEGDAYSVAAIVKIYESYGVSAHYLIDRSGTIYRLVADQNIAYHAGASKMPDGRKDVNDFSIGIEIMNTEDGQFTKAEYEAVNSLVTNLKKQYPIKSVVGHGDIAPGRKTDPWNFDWKKLKE
ncbi:MAG: N-acetylmuramoyl-L-alanine amidase [Candidatus Moranbacteria bacterium]|nr:N-acetylmuramoyl-L-alanine amidase [Candidatus Moranbacteria bacterium]